MLHRTISDQLVVVLYDSIKEMPADLYQTARQYEVMAAELGQNEGELDTMLARAENYALAGKLLEFREQMHNYRLARALVLDRFQAGQLDWACHVHAVNGEQVTDYSEDALSRKIMNWSALGLTQQLIEETLADVKKKRSDDLKRYFPKRFGQVGGRNQLEQVRQYLIAQLKAAIKPDDLALQIKLTEAFGLVVGQNKPVNFRPESSDLIEMEKGWGKLCVTLAECDCPNPKGLTIYELYTWLEALEEKYEALKKPTQHAPKR